MAPRRQRFRPRDWTLRRRLMYSLLVGLVTPAMLSWLFVLLGPYDLNLKLRRWDGGLDDRRAIWSCALPAPPSEVRATLPSTTHGRLRTIQSQEYFFGVVGERRVTCALTDPSQPLAIQHLFWSYGWPFPCLGHERLVIAAPDGVSPATIRTYWGLDIGLERHRHLPLRPLCVPFLLNTGVYGGLVFLTISVPRWSREMRPARVRLKRFTQFVVFKPELPGSCRHCGYDVQELPICPECGCACQTEPSAAAVQAPSLDSSSAPNDAE